MKSFTHDQLEQLKVSFSSIGNINPDKSTYSAMIKLVESLPSAQLKQLVDANIKWLSSLARNTLLVKNLA